ncbi:MAG: hypothetical protein M1821_005577 [Bathelium mastoideum]|nr:MAG: hypothetical protein M1821_005577 [Bathelium mastoideum]
MSFRTEILPGFSPPGNLDDFTPETRKTWSEQYISYWMNGEITADPNVVSKGRTELKQYFNGTITPFDTTQTPTTATWNAFPNLVRKEFGDAETRWKVADASRMFQDEYLEWSVRRDENTHEILYVEFTCEGPEYWQVFASYQRADFVQKMRDLNPDRAKEMSEDDFFLVDPKTGAQVYNPHNYWNIWSTSGTVAHLIQPNNTLSAEIDIAAQATVLRKKGGEPVTNEDQLILCSKYGNHGRNSDPTVSQTYCSLNISNPYQIGGTVNSAARKGKSLCVADPVALYIEKIDLSNFMYDTVSTDGEADQGDLIPIPNPQEVFKITRGDLSKQQGLRFQVRVPDGTLGKNHQLLNVSNIYDTQKGCHIRYGAQIADYVTMSVSVVTINAPVAAPTDCYMKPEVTTTARINPIMSKASKFL